MGYSLDITTQASADFNLHKQAGDKAVLNKIAKLLVELTEHPFTGTGKPEPLKNNLSGFWSRRITLKHRLIYTVQEDIVGILSAYGHYE
jgi:toxin YoeB